VSAPDAAPSEVYTGLRQQILDVDPAQIALAASPELPHVWGLVMESGYPNAVVTLVALADGTTSLYFSTGGGIIGGGGHPPVAAATRALLRVVEQYLPQMPASTDLALPATGQVALRALTYDGRRCVVAAEDDLGYRPHPLAEIFHAAHDVLTQLRLMQEAREG
jgi:hypothetical protein